jgi:hypothetical protein
MMACSIVRMSSLSVALRIEPLACCFADERRGSFGQG